MKHLNLMMLVLLLSQVVCAQDASNPSLKAVTSEGRQVLLKGDQTWEYIEFQVGDPSNSAVLTVTQVWEMQDACKIQFRLQNNLGYRISALVPRFSVQNKEGVLYESPSISFMSIKPTKAEYTQIQISGLGCKDISQMKLYDAARCRMGEIDQWNEKEGECLAHIYLEPTQLLNISK